MSLEDHPVASSKPIAARKKKSKIWSMMLAIVVLALALGITINWVRGQRRAVDNQFGLFSQPSG